MTTRPAAVVDHSPIGMPDVALTTAQLDRTRLAADAARLREQREQLTAELDRAHADRLDALADVAARDELLGQLRDELQQCRAGAAWLADRLDTTAGSLRLLARRTAEQRRERVAATRVLARFEDDVESAWDAMPRELVAAADHDNAGLPAAITTLVQIVERVLPGWFALPAAAPSTERAAASEQHVRRFADAAGSQLAESCALVLDELALHRQLRTRGGPAPAADTAWRNVDPGSPSSATLPQHEVTA